MGTINKIYYRLFVALLLIAILMGLTGIGMNSKGVHPRNSYLPLLQRAKFFGAKQYPLEMVQEVKKNLGLIRENMRHKRYIMDDQLKDQRRDLTLLKDRRLNQSLNSSMNARAYIEQVQDRVREQRFKNQDLQNHYRDVMDSRK